ncbi:MAG TPA: PadR family transcriptional regulator [Methanobacterium sp.]
MEEKGSSPLEGSEAKHQEFNKQNDKVDCDPDQSKKLKEYDIKLLRSMKGFGKTMILWLISKETIHGYELMRKINQINPSVEEKLKGGPGKIYPILHDLEKAGLIIGTWEAQGKRKIKYYEITEEGTETLIRIKKVFRCHRTPILEEFWRDMFSNK